MANNPEVNQWEAGIYQWEETDPVEGGVGGIDNKPMIQLGNRTIYLKSEIEKGQRININGELVQTTSTAIDLSNIGRVVKFAPATSAAIAPNLPADSDWPIGRNLFVRYPKGGSFSPVCSVGCTGSLRISDNENTSVLSSFTINPGQIVEFIKVATNLLIANVYHYNDGITHSDRQMTSGAPNAAYPITGGATNIASLTAAAGATSRKYLIMATFGFNRISSASFMVWSIYKNGSSLFDFQYEGHAVDGQSQSTTIQCLDTGVPGDVYTFHCATLNSNQSNLKNYTFTIDGQA